MPTVTVLYDPDEALGARLADLIPPDSDFLLIWRQWGQQFEGGSRTHVVGDGMWEHVTLEQVKAALEVLGEL